MSAANFRLEEFSIEKEFYDRDGKLVLLEVRRLANTGIKRYVDIEDLWTNETHNQIMDYIRENDVERDTYQEIRGYLNVKCIVTLRDVRDSALADLEDNHRLTAKMIAKMKHDIEVRTQCAEDLEQVDDLSDTIEILKDDGDWDLNDWDVRWRPGLEKSKKRKYVPYGSAKK